MEYIGYLSSILIGIILGLIGSGGSILTIPVLIYLFSVDVTLATTYSLLIVGVTSAVGSLSYLRAKLVNSKLALVFGLPSVLSVALTRTWLVPAIPKVLFHAGNFAVKKDMFLLLLFAVLMVFAAVSMIGKPPHTKWRTGEKSSYLLIIIQGLVLGVITGLVGAGGGFLIIPVLVILQKLPIKAAIGTSLVIIAANALLGFLFTHNKAAINWSFLFLICGLAIAGIFLGGAMARKMNPAKLRPVFGWVVLVMGAYIMIHELFLNAA